jgi:hypothetical protein
MNDFDWSDLDARSCCNCWWRWWRPAASPVPRSAGGDAVGGEPPAGQAARHHRRPAVRQERPRHRGHGARAASWPRGPRTAAPAGALRAGGDFDPARWQVTFTIAANDFQRDLLLPTLARRLREQAPGVVLRIIPSDVPSLEMLRERRLRHGHQPAPARGQRHPAEAPVRGPLPRLLRPGRTPHPAPGRVPAGDHITVVYEPRRSLDLDSACRRRVQRRFVVMVPGFAGLPAFMRAAPCWPPLRPCCSTA